MALLGSPAHLYIEKSLDISIDLLESDGNGETDSTSYADLLGEALWLVNITSQTKGCKGPARDSPLNAGGHLTAPDTCHSDYYNLTTPCSALPDPQTSVFHYDERADRGCAGSTAFLDPHTV